MDEKRTVRGFFDNGELRFAEPVYEQGCWKLEITFVEKVDEENVVLDANPHSPEARPKADRLEEVHRDMEQQRPRINPY